MIPVAIAKPLAELALKYGSKMLVGLVVSLFLIGVYIYHRNQILDEGKAIERADWLEKEAKERSVLEKELSAAISRVAKQNEDNDINTIKVQNEKDAEIDRLRNVLADNAKRVRISAKQENCAAGTLRGQAGGAEFASESPSESGVGGAGASNQSLDENQINQLTYGLWIEREELKVHLKACTQKLKTLVEVAH